jgi:hypothetical protein
VPWKNALVYPGGGGFSCSSMVTVRVPGAAGKVPLNCPAGGWVYTYSWAVRVSRQGPVVRMGGRWIPVTLR